MEYRQHQHTVVTGYRSLPSKPCHWQVKRLRFVVQTNPVKSEVANLDGDTLVSFVPMDAVGENGGMKLDAVKPISEVYAGYTYFQDEDVVVAKITPCFENGKGAIAKDLENEIGFGTTEFHVIRASKEMQAKFIFYLTLTHTFREFGSSEMLGAGGQKRIPEDFIKDFRVGLPPAEEQKKIAAFLDHKTKQIDQLIEKKKALIEKLEEKRIAVITLAVTKGLDKNAKLKPSGVDWLGDVPKHWDVLPIKYLCSLLKDGTHLPPARVDIGVPLLSVRNIVDGKFIFRPDDSNISEDNYFQLCKTFVPTEGDVLLAIVGATLGKVAIVEALDKFHIQRSLAVFRVDENLIASESLAYIFRSMNFQNLLWQNVGFSAQPGIYLGVLGEFKIPVPPIEEQAAINEYCKNSLTRVDLLIAKAKAVIERVAEYRSAIITAAVTGKIDVRKVKIPQDITG